MIKRILFVLLLTIATSCKKDKKKDVIFSPVETEITDEGKIISIDSVYMKTIRGSVVFSFYDANDFKTYWLANSCRQNLLSILENAESEGHNPQDFDLQKMHDKEDKILELDEKELVEYDFLLTENLYKFITLTAVGKTKPSDLYNDWDIKPNEVNAKELLLNFIKKDSFDYAVSEIAPKHPVYKKLRQSLKILDTFPEDDLKKIEIKDKIELNDSSEIMPDIKRRLIYWRELPFQDSLTYIYDEAMLNAVKKFQFRHGLATDGVIGKGTGAALNYTKEQRRQQIIANMERWRWYPRDFGNEYLLVNIPNYSLVVVKNNDTIRMHRIIVGTSKRKTPILTSKLSHIVLNPTWTIPPTILKEDVIPATIRNRNYLGQKNLTVYDSKGNVVSHENWKPEEARSYRYVQSPGKSNSLGLVKIMFPNNFSVYLHDTNSRSYFERENLSLSSGCVRVQNPFELTEYLLDDSENWSMDKIQEVINEGKTININLKKTPFLYLYYWTAWLDNNQLIFRDDIYNLDKKLYEKLRN